PKSRHHVQPMVDAATMCDNAFKSDGTFGHLFAFRPNMLVSLTTFGLCHMTPTPSGMSPPIMRLAIDLTSQPLSPVISAWGSLAVPVIFVLLYPGSTRRHRPARRCDTQSRRSTVASHASMSADSFGVRPSAGSTYGGTITRYRLSCRSSSRQPSVNASRM